MIGVVAPAVNCHEIAMAPERTCERTPAKIPARCLHFTQTEDTKIRTPPMVTSGKIDEYG